MLRSILSLSRTVKIHARVSSHKSHNTRSVHTMSVDPSTIVTNEDVLKKDPSGSLNAVVILLGWLGATHRPVAKYAELYQKKGCVTIAATAPTAAVMSNNVNTLRELGISTLRKAAYFIREAEAGAGDSRRVPLIIHVFSNGGATVVENIEHYIHDFIPNDSGGSLDATDHKTEGISERTDVELVAERLRLGGQVFDSAPVSMQMQAGLNAIGHAVSGNALMRYTAQGAFFLYVSLATIVNTVIGTPVRQDQFWEHMQESDLGCKQYYVYSEDDALTPVDTLDELIAYRRAKGVDITTLRLVSSPHVAHLKSHPELYNKFVDNILAEAGQRTSHTQE